MMFSGLTPVILTLFLSSAAIETDTEEDLEQVKFFNHDIRLSRSEVLKLLEKANLTSHGYEREVSTKTVRRPGSDKSEFKKSYFYYKVVSCSRSLEVEHELNTLMTGIFDNVIASQLKSEVKIRHLGSTGQCKVGLEVNFAKVVTYQLNNHGRLFSIGRSLGLVPAKRQVNDDHKKTELITYEVQKAEKDVIDAVQRAEQEATKTVQRAKAFATKAVQRAKAKAKESIREANKKATKKVQRAEENVAYYVQKAKEKATSEVGRAEWKVKKAAQAINETKARAKEVAEEAKTKATTAVACEAQTHFRSSLLSLRKIASANPSDKTISVT